MGVGYFRNNSSAHWLWRLTLAQGLCIHCLSTLKAVLRLQLKKLRLREAPGCSSWKTERLGALFHSLWLHKPARSPYTMFIRCGGTEFCFISKHKFCLVLLTPQGNLEILTASFHCPCVFRSLFFFLPPLKKWLNSIAVSAIGPKAVPQLGRLKRFALSLQKTDSQENMIIPSDLLGEMGNKSGSPLEASPCIQ